MQTVVRPWLALGALMLVVGFAAPTLATPIAPGGVVSPVSGEPCPACGGPFLADTGGTAWGSGSFSGFYRSVVYQGAGGGLEFWYQALNDSTSTAAIQQLLMTSFLGWGTDVLYYDVGGGGALKIPTGATRSASGDEIGFQFGDLAPGTQSQAVVIRTNATAFRSGSLVISTGGSNPTQETVAAFAPTPIPEPGSMTLVGLGLAFVARRLCRRRH
jgi:hypothetical protein